MVESFAPGAVVAEVARRHDMRAQQVHGWRRDAREGRLILPAVECTPYSVHTSARLVALSNTEYMAQHIKPEQRARILSAIKDEGMSITDAAKTFLVSESTLQKWVRKQSRNGHTSSTDDLPDFFGPTLT